MKLYWQPGVTLKQAEKEIILDAYRFYGGNKTATASSLNISVRTLFDKLAEYENKGKRETGLKIGG